MFIAVKHWNLFWKKKMSLESVDLKVDFQL